MALPKVRTGRLAPDQEALDYYNTPVKHWTANAWDQIDMDRVDMGLHSDPSPTGTQAADRRSNTKALNGPSGLGADETKDMRIHIGNELMTRDAGQWHRPDYARDAILNSLMDDNWELGELFEEAFPQGTMSRGSTIEGNPRAIEDTKLMRQWLLDNEYDTITYNNTEEGVKAAADAAINSPEMLEYEAKELARIKDYEMQALEAERRGDMDAAEELESKALALDDELNYWRDDAARQAEVNNLSHISLDPGNVRSADAAFQKDMIGKPDMMGSATTPMLGALAGLGATGSVLASQGLGENLSQGWEALKGMPQMLLEDAKAASEGLHYGLTGERMEAPIPQLNKETPLGNALGQDIGNYISGIDLNPFPGEYTVGQAMGDAGDAYNKYVKPHLSERQEAGLGGGALMASMIGMNPAKNANHLKRKGDADKIKQATAEGGALVAPQKIRPEDLLNRPYVSNMADTSVGDNSIITSIDGVPVDVNREGGFDFMRQPENVEDGRLWASDRGAVSGILNSAGEAMALPGAQGSPLMLPWSMTPGRSSDFAHFSANLGAQHGRQVLDPRIIESLDHRVRVGKGNRKNEKAPVPEWAGLMNATPEHLQAIGGKRKNFLAALDEYRQAGALDQSSIRHAVGDQIATESYIPAQLLRVGEIDMNRGIMDDSRHTTYNSGVPGAYLGNLNPGASILDDPGAILRSGINLRDKYGPRKNVLPSNQGKAMQSNAIGVLTEPVIEEWIRRGVFD